MSEKKTFVGFGFGAIQAGLFLYEAQKLNAFDRYVIAEVNTDLIDAITANNGCASLNIAHDDGIENATLEGLELYSPKDSAGREAIINAVAEASEMATG